MLGKKEEKNIHEDDRLSKFTEYRGGSEEPARSISNGRRGSAGHELRKEPDNNHFDRERGQSVPPGANIESMGDFYKTNQYRSMYHLPPSPSRPAPVLDRGGKTQTLERATLHRERSGDFIKAPPRRLAKTSISEGELTDDQARQERVIRQRNKFLNNMMNKNGDQATLNRRVVSSERESDGRKIYGELNNGRTQELKARIHVSSPIRHTPERPASRKPYKTTINTATDTIQYKGFSSEMVVDKNDPRYKLRQSGKKVDTEHYKVPKNKAPVPADFITKKGIRTDSENSSSAYNGNYHIPEKNQNVKSQFASTSLVRNIERGNKRGEYDREGRRIHSERRSTERNRAYSGYSTSPDRELSPDRYAKPRGSKIQLTHRSPSSSPTRPPRTRSSPNREIQIPIRREHSGREVERSPSTRAAATSRSPIKKIQRVHNEIKGDKKEREPSPHKARTLTLTRNKGDKSGIRGVKTMLGKKEEKNIHEDDRLSKFTEYRGGSEEPARSISNGRRGSAGHELRKEPDNNHFDRERGQSVPPGANIESMGDFYKTNQYRSMYHLPPSPSRPAPVLDRGGKTQTLERATLHRERSGDFIKAPPRRLAKTSISEGELTDDQARQERVIRQRNKFLNNMMNKNGDQATLNRRVVSSERESDGRKIYGELNNGRTQELKARIHVSSPIRHTPERPASRKPYKTTINTATDTIQYKGFSSEMVVDKNDPRYKLRQSGKKVDTEHYKVPKNKAPVPADFYYQEGDKNRFRKFIICIQWKLPYPREEPEC
eukprot:TRINITY_DN9243_c0_g1_i1.p1 TRINITY_DN9243_c0_g1~~TRINITY_DN9243_c0_g1_i1.p1  ORF type:complete len:775 (+),score=136.58 TRINITY_DN9243_c0_g1_i1:1772-4096(+)